MGKYRVCIDFICVHAERIGHAKEFMETFDLSTITGIVLASGDGIIYEVLFRHSTCIIVIANRQCNR